MSKRFLAIYRAILASPAKDPMEEDDSVVHAVLSGLDAKVCSLWKINSNSGTVSVMTRAIADRAARIEWKPADFVHPIAGSATEIILKSLANSGDPYHFIPDVHKEPWGGIHQSREAVSKLKLRSQITIPVSVPDQGNGPIALLNIYFNKKVPIHDEDTRTLSAFVSIAVRKSETLLRERVTQELMAEFSGANNIARSLSNGARAIISSALSAEQCDIFLWNRHRTHLDQLTENESRTSYTLNQGIIGWCVRTGRPALLPDIKSPTPHNPSYEQKTENLPLGRDRSLVAMYIPIKKNGAEGEPLGAIRLVNKKSRHGGLPDYFSDSDVRLAEYIALLLSFFIDKKIQDDHKQGFLADLAHEVLSPAAGIRGAAEHLLGRNLHAFERSRFYTVVQDISMMAGMQVSLVHSLYRAWEMSAGIPNSEVSDFDLHDILYHAKRTVIPLARSTGVPFDKISVSGPNPKLRMPKNSLREVFVNLLSNAVKYCDQKNLDKFNVAMRVEIDFSIIRIVVEDDGIGIDRDERRLIFERGYRGANIRRISVRGLGIGLFVANSIVQGFGGRLFLENPNGPTRFTVEIPTQYLAT